MLRLEVTGNLYGGFENEKAFEGTSHVQGFKPLRSRRETWGDR